MTNKNLKKRVLISIVAILSAFMIIQVFSCTPAGVKKTVKKKKAKIKPKIDRPQVFFKEGDAVKINSVAPTFLASTITGKVVDSSNNKDSITLLNFWSIRCGPCIKEMPYLEKLYEQFKDSGLKIHAINTDQASIEEVTAFIKSRDFDVTYDVLADPDLVLSSVFTKWFVPVTILIDSKGVMRYNHTGFTKRDYAKYKKLIKNLFEE